MNLSKEIKLQAERVEAIRNEWANTIDIAERDYLYDMLWNEERELEFLQEEYAPIQQQIDFMWSERQKEI